MSTDVDIGPKIIETAKSATRELAIFSAKLGGIGVLILVAIKFVG